MQHFEANLAKKAVSFAKKGKAKKAVLLYPATAHRVVQIPRESRTHQTAGSSSESPKGHWTVVENANHDFRNAPTLPPIDPELMPPLSYECDGRSDDVLQPGPAALALPLKSAAEYDSSRAERQSGRPKLLQAYHMATEEFEVDIRHALPPSDEIPGSIKLLVSLQDLCLRVEGAELLYASLALWNVCTGQKLSEDFCCNLNNQRPKWQGAIFTVAQSSEDVMIVANISKTLRGDSLDHIVDLYSSGKALPSKTRQEIQDNGERMKEFLQPLAVAVVPLFRPDGSLSGASMNTHCSLIAAPRVLDADWVRSKLGGGESVRKVLRTLPGALCLNIVVTSDEIPGRMSSDGSLLKPILGRNSPQQPILEIRPFCPNPADSWPLYESVNLLFVNPLTLNFQKFGGPKARNLIVQVMLKDNDDDPLDPGMPVMFARLGTEDWVRSVSTSVSYHDRKPSFMEEFKCRLPESLTPAHHLVFLISHVTCKPEPDHSGSLSSPVAFAFLPLVIGSNVIHDGIHSLCVSSSFPPRYMSEYGTGLLQWIEKRPSLQVGTRLQSSIHPSDPNLRAFLHIVSQPKVVEAVMGDLSRCSGTALIQSLPKVLDALFYAIATQDMSVGVAALEELFSVLDRVSEVKGGDGCGDQSPLFDSYIGFGLTLPKEKVSATAVYKLVVSMTSVLQNPKLVEPACRFASVVCSAVVKWMFLVAEHEDTLEKSDRSGRFPVMIHEAIAVLMETFLSKLHDLSLEMIALARALGQTVSLFLLDLLCVMDRGFALGQVVHFVQNVQLFSGTRQQKQLLDSIKMSALSLICSHEHFVGLNFGRKQLISLLIRSVLDQQHSRDKAIRLLAMSALRNSLVKQGLDSRYQSHSLKSRVASMYFSFVGLFIKERPIFWGSYSLEERRTALFCFLYIVKNVPKAQLTHWWASQSLEMKNEFFRVLCRIVLIFEYRGPEYVDAMTRDFTVMKLSRVKQLNASIIGGDGGDSAAATLRSWKAAYIAPKSSVSKGGDASDSSQTTASISTPEPSSKSLSLSASDAGVRSWKKQANQSGVTPVSPRRASPPVVPTLNIVGGGDTSVRSWRKKMSPRAELSATSTAAGTFTSSSSDVGVRSWKKQANNSARSPRTSPRGAGVDPSTSTTGVSLASDAGVRSWKKQETASLRPSTSDAVTGSESTSIPSGSKTWREKRAARGASEELKANNEGELFDEILIREQHLSREAILTVLDLTMMYVEFFVDSLVSGDDSMLGLVMETFTHLLHVNHCEETFTHVASAARLIICTFRKVFFSLRNGYAQELTHRIMILFSSLNGSIRGQAAVLMHALMRENYRTRNNCRRMMLAGTIGVNRLSEPGLKIAFDRNRFVESLEYMQRLGKGCNFENATFEFHDMVSSVLTNMARISECTYDPERLAELYFELCENYQKNPDIKAAWLHTLAFLHERNGHHEEAAQCRIHLSALISTFLALVKPQESVPVDEIAFAAAAPNVAGEFKVPAALALDDEGICQSDMFTRTGLFHQLGESVRLLQTQSLYESCIAVSRLMGAIHLRNRDWRQYATGMQDLAGLCSRIVDADQAHSRIFSKWYRVNFFGSVFGPMAGSKWVYKESSEVLISDICDRLKRQFASAFGDADQDSDSVVTVLPNGQVDMAKLEPGRAYLQVAAIVPFLDTDELTARQTDFERQSNIDEFVMETPFTKDGNVHGGWDEQYMRRAVMKVSAKFPNVLKRLPVISEHVSELPPIQNALSVIQERVVLLRKQVEDPQPSLKSVQQYLQGSVLLQVNPGPLAIGQVFLDAKSAPKYPAKQVQLLREAMSNFVIQSRALLLLNGAMISTQQLDYQIALTDGYNDMRKKLSPFIADGGLPLAAAVDVPLSSAEPLSSR